MRIVVYGPGCARCKQAEKAVINAVTEAGVDADVQKVEDIAAMVKAGVLSTPAIEIDGKVVMAGRVPTPEEIAKLLRH